MKKTNLSTAHDEINAVSSALHHFNKILCFLQKLQKMMIWRGQLPERTRSELVAALFANLM